MQRKGKILRGHEIWLEVHHIQDQKGGDTGIKAGWGHALEPDGLGEREKWSSFVRTPAGDSLRLPILESKGEYYLLPFEPKKEGSYVVGMENNYGVGTQLKNGDFRRGPKKNYEHPKVSSYFYQFAKTFLHVGDQNETPLAINAELEIIPLSFDFENLEVEVKYRGDPLAEAPVKAVYERNRGDFGITTSTDKEGKAKFTLDKKGLWMLKVSHLDADRKLDSLYDRTHLTATCTVPGGESK